MLSIEDMVEAFVLCVAHMATGLPLMAVDCLPSRFALEAPSSLVNAATPSAPTIFKEEEPARKRHIELLAVRTARHLQLAGQHAADDPSGRRYSLDAAQFVMTELSLRCVNLRI